MLKLSQPGAPELAPEWKPSNLDRDGNYQPMYRGSSGAQRVVARVETEDDFVDISVPHAAYEKWLDTSGGQANLIVSPARDPEQADPRYKEYIRRSRARHGWVPYNYFTALEYTPHMVNGATEAQWPARLDEIAKKYKARHARKEEKSNKLAQSEIKLLIDSVKESRKK